MKRGEAGRRGVQDKLQTAELPLPGHSQTDCSFWGAFSSRDMQPCAARCVCTQPCRVQACFLCMANGCAKQAPRATLCPCIRYTELTDKYADESVPLPRPEHWGGYLIRPTAIEFWQGRPSRVHDRIVFRRAAPGEGQPWVMERLQP